MLREAVAQPGWARLFSVSLLPLFFVVPFRADAASHQFARTEKKEKPSSELPGRASGRGKRWGHWSQTITPPIGDRWFKPCEIFFVFSEAKKEGIASPISTVKHPRRHNVIGMETRSCSNRVDEFLILVRFDGVVQCIDLQEGHDLWSIVTKGGSLSSYENSTGVPGRPPKNPTSEGGDVDRVNEGSESCSNALVAASAVPVLLAAYGAGSIAHTFVLHNSDLVVADDHRILNQDLLVHSLAAFNSSSSEYLEVHGRTGEVLVNGVDDTSRGSPTQGGAPAALNAIGAGPCFAVIRQNKWHAGRLRQTRRGTIPSTWKFLHSTVTVVDLESPSLRSGATPPSAAIMDRDHGEDSSDSGASTPTATGHGIGPKQSSPCRQRPSVVEVFVDGRWRVSKPHCGARSPTDSSASDVFPRHPMLFRGATEECEIIKAYHYFSLFPEAEKLKEVQLRIFDNPLSPNSHGNGVGCCGCPTSSFYDRAGPEIELYVKPQDHFVYCLGDVPPRFELHQMLRASNKEPSRDVWKARVPLSSAFPMSATSAARSASDLSRLAKGLRQPIQAIASKQRELEASAVTEIQSLSSESDETGRECNQGNRDECSSASVPAEHPSSGSETSAAVTTALPCDAPAATAPTETSLPAPSTASLKAADMFLLRDDDSSDDSDTDAQTVVTQIVGADGGEWSGATTQVRGKRDGQLRGSSSASSATTNALTGSSFFDTNFETLRVLGRGASGIVLLCRQRVTNFLYAVKLVVAESKLDEQDILREVKLHAALQSDHIVRYHSCWSETVSKRRAAQIAKLVSEAPPCSEQGLVGYESVSDASDDNDTVTDVSETTLSTAARNVGRTAIFLQMEYCNTTLAARLGMRRTIDRLENMCIAVQLCRGLAYLHSRGIVHRDLKPSNVMLLLDCASEDRIRDDVLQSHTHWSPTLREDAVASSRKAKKFSGSGGSSSSGSSGGANSWSDSRLVAQNLLCPFLVKLGDLGLAKTEGESHLDPVGYFAPTEAHTVGIGSPIYSSPEQLAGKTCSAAGDIFSLGVLFLELYLTPATVAERQDVLLRLRSGTVSPSLISAYPELTLALVMTNPRPEKRPKAEQVLRKLNVALEGLIR